MTTDSLNSPYFDEIDLRPYITNLLRFWYLLIIIPIIAVVVTYLVMRRTLPPLYTAVALVTFTQQRTDVVLDGRIIDSEAPLSANSSFPELALSDSVIQELFLRAQDDLPPFISSQFALRSHLEAENGNDISVIRLNSQWADPVLAANIANLWAEIFVESINQVLGNENKFALEGELQDALDERLRVESEFVTFRENDQTAILQAHLTNELTTLNTALNRKRNIQSLFDQLTNLETQVQSSTESFIKINDTAIMLFQLQAFDLDGSNKVEINPSTFESGLTIEEQLEHLMRLRSTLEAEDEQLNILISETEPKLLTLQSEIANIENQSNILREELALALQVHQSISRKVEELDVSSDIDGQVRMASQAAVPVTPESRFSTIAAIGLFSFIGIFLLIIAITWWQQFTRNDAT